MRFLRIWADDNGVSHIEELTTSFTPIEDYARGIPTVGISERAAGEHTYLLSMPPGFFGDWHPAPRRQLMAQLQGELRVTLGDGTSVEATAGTLWCVEDLTGAGHQTEVTGERDALFLVVSTPDGWTNA